MILLVQGIETCNKYVKLRGKTLFILPTYALTNEMKDSLTPNQLKVHRLLIMYPDADDAQACRSIVEDISCLGK